ncbi:MAG: type 4a pilus biogenesis protein PilO [Sandaracinaceae bacterium]|nr:type 4a pilus biogenesis protein PilO [Sandaracinaceae bacterium]
MAKPAKKQTSGGSEAFSRLPVAGKAAIGIGIVAVIGAVYYFALHMSMTDDITTAQQQHATLQTRMSRARAQNAEYVSLREELAQREGLDRANLRALPAEAETASFLQDLNRLAELSGLEIRLVEPRPEESADHYVRLPVRLQLGGRYHQIARFFYNVSRLDRLISMENLNLGEPAPSAAQSQVDEVIISVEVLATTFRRPDEAEPQAAATPPGAPAPQPRTGT